jgi:hypothetical protein
MINFGSIGRAGRSTGTEHLHILIGMTRIVKSPAKPRGRARVTKPGRRREEFRRLKGDPTGATLIAVMQASPHRDIELEPKRAPMPVREVFV